MQWEEIKRSMTRGGPMHGGEDEKWRELSLGRFGRKMGVWGKMNQREECIKIG